jgi:hypothetical protein
LTRQEGFGLPDRWKSKVDALIRLADDQAGKPEGELAKAKLKQILALYPEAAKEHAPFEQYAWRIFTLGDLKFMKQWDISIGGSWTGRNLQEAIATMIVDFWQRIDRWQQPMYLLGAGIAGIVNERIIWLKM